MRKWREESILDLYNLVLAAALFTAPWFFPHASRAAGLDLRLSSAAIICLSLAAVFAFSIWEEWANVALSAWLIVSPWCLGFAHTRAMHFSIAIGAVIGFLAVLDAWLRREAAERQTVSSANTHPG